MPSQPPADTSPRRAFDWNRRSSGILERSVAIVRRALYPRETSALGRRTECIQPSGGADENDDDDQDEREKAEEHAAETGTWKNGSLSRQQLMVSWPETAFAVQPGGKLVLENPPPGNPV